MRRGVSTTVGRARRLLLILLLSACADAGDEPPATTRIDTLPGGRVRVTNTGVPDWPSGVPWRLEEDLRLGTARPDGPQPELFAAPAAVSTDSQGRIFVLEARSQQEIRVFEPSGVFSHTFSRQGEGPGEIARAESMIVDPGDTLWVFDVGARRYSAFATDGTFLEVRRRPTSLGWYEGYGFLADGSLLDWSVQTAGPREQVVLHPIRLKPGFREADTLPPYRTVRK